MIQRDRIRFAHIQLADHDIGGQAGAILAKQSNLAISRSVARRNLPVGGGEESDDGGLLGKRRNGIG